MATYEPDDLAKAMRHKEQTRNGVYFHWELAGPGGASFVLFREPHHTDADIEAAEHQIRTDRDVVRLVVALPAKPKARRVADMTDVELAKFIGQPDAAVGEALRAKCSREGWRTTAAIPAGIQLDA